MKIISIVILLAGVTLLGLFTSACPERKTIAEIEAHAGRYQDKEVTVAGVVRDSYGVSIPGTRTGGGAYKIDDGTGSIWVIVADGSVPLKGAEIAVNGVVGTGVNWKGQNYGLGMYEKGRHYRKH